MCSRVGIYINDHEFKQRKFIAFVQLTDRSIGWLMSEIEEWLNKKQKNGKGIIF